MQLGPVGLWTSSFRNGPVERAREEIAELEELGYPAVWIPGGATAVILDLAAALLDASQHIVIASGILNVWLHQPADVARSHHQLNEAHPGRFLLGLGVSHASIVEQNTEQRYGRPLAVMASFLDGLDSADTPVPKDERVLAALGPRMLELARDRSAGAHPYCVTPEHTQRAREVLGEGPILAPELKAVLERDAGRARAIARSHIERYFKQPNYVNNLLRLGYTEGDLAHGGTDRIIDELFAWGSVEDVAARVSEHHKAGADHVCVQVLREDPAAYPKEEWRALAEVLL